MAPTGGVLLRGGTRRVRGVAGTHAGDLFEVQQHRRPDRRPSTTTRRSSSSGSVERRTTPRRRCVSGEITREEAVALIKRFDGEFPERFADEILAYLSLPEKEFPLASKQFEQPIMDRAYFAALTDRFRSPHLWQYADGKWSLAKHRLDGFAGFQGMSELDPVSEWIEDACDRRRHVTDAPKGSVPAFTGRSLGALRKNGPRRLRSPRRGRNGRHPDPYRRLAVSGGGASRRGGHVSISRPSCERRSSPKFRKPTNGGMSCVGCGLTNATRPCSRAYRSDN